MPYLHPFQSMVTLRKSIALDPDNCEFARNNIEIVMDERAIEKRD